MSTANEIVVIAWIEHVLAPLGNKWLPQARAAVWSNDGDVAGAVAHAKTLSQAAHVYLYPASEPDPLGKARGEEMRPAVR